MPKKPKVLLMGANVLIDYQKSDFSVLKAIEPELHQLTRAASKRGQLSFRDHLCLIVASDASFVCVTHDKPLRNACTADGVSILWGLEIMTALVRRTPCARPMLSLSDEERFGDRARPVG